MKIQNILIALLFVLSPMATIGAGAQNPVWGEGGLASGAGIGSEGCTDEETGVSLFEPLTNEDCRAGLLEGDACADPDPDTADPFWSQACMVFVGILGWSLSENDHDGDGRADTAYFEADNPVAGMGVWDPTKSEWADEWLDACYLDGALWGLSQDDCDDYTFNAGETVRVHVQLDYIDNSDDRAPVVEVQGDQVHIHVINAMFYGPDGRLVATGQTDTLVIDSAHNSLRSGLLVVDIDPIDPLTSRELESDNSIEESRNENGEYLNNVATWIYIEIPAMPMVPDVFGFPDETGFDFSKIHVKWPGFRGEPVDLVGLYGLKYANLDDDPDTDLGELLCAGQPTNPTNPNAHCGDWDGDSLPNDEDPNPRKPNVFMTLGFADAGVGGGEWEAPHAGGFTYDCSGPNVDMRLWVSYNGGNWQYRPGFTSSGAANPTSGQTGCVQGGTINPYTETNSGTGLRTVSYKLTTSTSAGVGFESNTISYTLLGNTPPGGEFLLECHNVDARDGDPCEGDGHIDNRVGYTFKFVIDGTGLDDEIGFHGAPQQMVTGRFACENINGADIDRDSATGRQCASVSRDEDGNIVYRVPDDGRYFAGANVVVDLTARDNGMAQTTHRYEFTIPKARPVLTAPALSQGLTGSISATVHLYDGGQHRHGAMDVNLHWRHEGEDEFQQVKLACSTDCAARDTVGNNPAHSRPLTHQGMTFSGSFSPDAESIVEYYFTAVNPYGLEGETDLDTFDVGPATIPSPNPEDIKVPNPIDYLAGDCNFMLDLLIMLGLAEGEFCASEIAQVPVPALDRIDFRDVDGDPSNDDEPNGQIDAVEMYVGYWQERDGRFNLHIMSPSGSVQPATDEAVRISIGDETAGPNAGDDITKYIVVEGQGEAVCLYAAEDADFLVGTGSDEAAACANRTSVHQDGLNILGAALGAVNEELTGQGLPLFEIHDENGDQVPESITVNIVDLTSCGPVVGDPTNGEVGFECADVMTQVIPIGGMPEGFPPSPDELCEDPEEGFPGCLAEDGSEELSADAGGEYSGAPGDAITISGSGSGGAGDYTCSWDAPGGVLADASACDTTVTYDDEGEYMLTLTVTDAADETATDSATVTVAAAGGCDGIPVPELGCVPDPTEDLPGDPNDLCMGEGEFPDCLGVPSPDENNNGMPDALEETFAPSCFDYAGQPVYFCQHGMGNGVGGAIYGDDWEGYAIIVFGIVVML